MKKLLLSTCMAAGLFASVAHANDTADLVREFYAAVDDPSQDFTTLNRFFADTYVDHDRNPMAPAEFSDRDVMLNLFRELETGLPGSVHRLEFVEPIGDDRAVVYWTLEATHTGPIFGVPASGNAVQINGVDIFRAEDGKFVEQWHIEELLSFFQQIGAQ